MYNTFEVGVSVVCVKDVGAAPLLFKFPNWFERCVYDGSLCFCFAHTNNFQQDLKFNFPTNFFE